jgi:hypothetical protein
MPDDETIGAAQDALNGWDPTGAAHISTTIGISGSLGFALARQRSRSETTGLPRSYEMGVNNYAEQKKSRKAPPLLVACGLT